MILTLWTPYGNLTCEQVSVWLTLFQAVMNVTKDDDQKSVWERNATLLTLLESAYTQQNNERALAFVRAVKTLKPE